MIIWVDSEGRITMVSHTPRTSHTWGGYDVDEIPVFEEGETRFNVETKEFYAYTEEPDDE